MFTSRFSLSSSFPSFLILSTSFPLLSFLCQFPSFSSFLGLPFTFLYILSFFLFISICTLVYSADFVVQFTLRPVLLFCSFFLHLEIFRCCFLLHTSPSSLKYVGSKRIYFKFFPLSGQRNNKALGTNT